MVILRAAEGAKVWSSGHSVDELPKAGADYREGVAAFLEKRPAKF